MSSSSPKTRRGWSRYLTRVFTLRARGVISLSEYKLEHKKFDFWLALPEELRNYILEDGLTVVREYVC